MGPVLWVWSEQLPSKCPASFLAPWAAQETLEGQYLILFSWFLAAHGDLSGTLLCSKEWEFRGCARWSWEMFVLAQTHCLDWRGLIPLWIPAFKRAPHRDEFWPAAHRDRRRKLQQCHPALHCQEPPWYIIHCPDFLWHRCQGWGLWAHCRYMFIFGIWFWLFDWKQKEVLSSDLQSVLAKRPRLPMPLTLNTGAVAGSCSLWGLAPREMGLVLSESCQQRFLLAPGYETQLCGITEQSVGGKPPLKCGVLTPKAGVCEQPRNKLTFTLAQRPHETPGCSQASQQGYASDQLEKWLQWESSGAAESYSSKSNISLPKVPITLKV